MCTNFVLICVLFYSVYFMSLFCALYICVFCVFVDPAFGCYAAINVCVCMSVITRLQCNHIRWYIMSCSTILSPDELLSVILNMFETEQLPIGNWLETWQKCLVLSPVVFTLPTRQDKTRQFRLVRVSSVSKLWQCWLLSLDIGGYDNASTFTWTTANCYSSAGNDWYTWCFDRYSKWIWQLIQLWWDVSQLACGISSLDWLQIQLIWWFQVIIEIYAFCCINVDSWATDHNVNFRLF